MKTIRKDKDPKTDYPRLVTNVNESAIIFLYANSRGVVVDSVTDNCKVGEHRTDWIEDNLNDYRGTVTISNS